MEKLCSCKKVKFANIPCSQKIIKCNLVCGKLLSCSFIQSNENNFNSNLNSEFAHYCKRTCHDGDCLKFDDETLINLNSNYRLIKDKNELICLQKCQRIKICGHKCLVNCHGLSRCPTSICQENVYVSCECGERIEKIKCNELYKEYNEHELNVSLDKLDLIKKVLECNSKCKASQRNKKLASALNLDLVTHYKGFFPKQTNNIDNPDYSTFLLVFI